MAKRTKILILCETIEKTCDECLEWFAILEEHLGKKAKSNIEARRVETPFVIIDFVFKESDYRNEYKLILNNNEDDEKLLRLAIGEESLEASMEQKPKDEIKESINNSAYLLSCECPDCGNQISRGYEESVLFCGKCGKKLHLRAFTEKEIEKARFDDSMDDYEN